MQDIIKTLFTRSWLLALAGAAVIGAQPVSAQTAADSKHDRTVRSRIALAQVLPNLDAGRLQVKLVEVTYPPGGFSAPHTHPLGCFRPSRTWRFGDKAPRRRHQKLHPSEPGDEASPTPHDYA